MCKEGLPIEGFCVAAGVPTTEKAVEIIDGLKTAGIRHVAFKPKSIDGIHQVVNNRDPSIHRPQTIRNC